MKKLYTFLSCFSLLLFLIPFTGYGQGCDNKVTVTAGGLGVRSKPGSTGVATFDYCPNGTNSVVLSGFSSTPNSTLVWTATTSTTTVTIPSTSTTEKDGTYSSISVNPQANTTYTLTSQSGCKAGVVANASVAIAPTLTVASTSSFVCAGGTATLTATGSDTGQYTWSGPGINTITTTGSLDVSPTFTTTYTVTAPTACGTSTQQITITVKSITIAPSAPAICSGQSISLAASYNGASVTAYQWFNIANPSEILSTGSTLTVAPTTTTTYQVTATTSDCFAVTQQVTVTVGAPTITVSPSAVTICSLSPTTLTANSNNPNTTYSWIDKADTRAVVLSTTSTYTAAPRVTTTYQVTATTCGTPITRDVVVTVATPTFAVTLNPASICEGSSTTLTALSNISSATFKWFEGTTSTTVISISSSIIVAPTATTTYRVETTTSCAAVNTQNVTVTVNSKPTVAVTPASATIAKGESITLTASGATTYNWSPASGLNTTTGAVVTATPTRTTTYTVTGINSSGCTNTSQVTVTVPGTEPLPVELTKFEAAAQNNNALLTWATASEKNNDHFEVERSTNGTMFERVGTVKGNGTTSSAHQYSFVDAGASRFGQQLYYRLRQVDTDGTEAFSPVRAVAFAPQAAHVTLYPNPATTTTTLDLSTLPVGTYSATVIDMTGRTLMTQQVTGGLHQPLAVSQLPAGTYLIRIQGINTSLTQRLIKQK